MSVPNQAMYVLDMGVLILWALTAALAELVSTLTASLRIVRVRIQIHALLCI